MLLQSKKQKLNKAKKQQHESTPGMSREIASEGTNSSSGVIRKSESILSPHFSIFQALHNPELELDLSALENGPAQRIPTPLNLNPELNAYNNSYRNEDFSITSWQSIHSSFGFAESNASPANMVLRSTAKLNSPNIGSILSSSDNEERNLEDTSVQHPTHQVLVFDSESSSESSEDEQDTIEMSTAAPSFVMPRVSVSGLSGHELVFHDKVRIQVVGYQKEVLLSRLSTYRKTLNRIVFTDSNPSIMIVVVKDDNYLLSDVVDKPFVPLLTGISVDLALFKKSFPKNLMICEPIQLQSITDDLMPFIEFLTNLQVSGCDFSRVLELSISQYSMTNQHLSMDKVNSILLDNSAKQLRRRSIHKEAGDPEKKKSYPKLHRHGLFLGLTVGMVSLAVLMIWKELASSADTNKLESSTRIHHFVVKPKDVIHSECSGGKLNQHAIAFSVSSLCDSAVKGSIETWEFIKTDLDALGKLLINSSYFLIERTKLTLLRIIELTEQALSY
ncbi:hypothetical protein KL933_005040 [Ogataea haglerorum]|uniref:Uncharacterized protein n=1 Tax=Ogataea haglerorum TaxID=1937702 RepID=A0AAN6HYA4_9ASCO|nr:uncharacterized protein KL911_005074 [Ogataea haglerorum]KAG7691723.1 hypothetical protein KL915_005030 [Ogataea haglerorum]KAG7692429.1 hypothetical protein KL951_005034 [Ogataea haglerorum]KAG7724078.1 hypothetical protein KL933_005040 [Ogataea haglerorum]KAG7725113.1 hypothetical protein KL948_005026 [Ogataea haglerorum]KAG7744904.1 hypothetical protein KL912_005057 [Ogataea haglerorum]